MKKRIVSLLLALVMVLSLVPTTVWAAEDHDGQVRVIVENTTYAKADGAAWDGTLVDKWVDLVPGSSMTASSPPWGAIPRPGPTAATSPRSTA